MFSLFRGFRAILTKEFIIVLRDPMTLFFMLFPPLIEMIAFGYAVDTDVKRMATVVLNEDNTYESRRYLESLENTETFRITAVASSIEELEAEIRKGKAYVGVQIPPGFARDLQANKTAQVQVLIDGSNSTVALQALNTAMGVTLREALMRALAKTGDQTVSIEVRPQMLYNPTMRSPNFYIPGVIGVVLQIATTFATAMALVRERERGTLEQLLVSPLSRWGLMLGKIIPYLVIGMIMASFLFTLMRYLFRVPIAGSVPWLMISTFIYIFSLLSLGLLISTRAANQMQALQMSIVLIMPTVFFSGFIFPRETMPGIFYGIGALLPTTYYISILRAVILRGASLAEFYNQIVLLGIMGVVLFALSALRFRKHIG